MPEIWMTHYHPEKLAAAPEQWPLVRNRLDVLQVYINTVPWNSPEAYQPLVELLAQNDIKIAIECGYFDWQNEYNDWLTPREEHPHDRVRTDWHDRVGYETAKMEIGKISKLTATGAAPGCLNLDGTIRRMLRPGQDANRNDVVGYSSLPRVMDAMVQYMQTWRESFPEIEFLTCCNFPNWGWKGDCSYWNDGMFNGDYNEIFPQMLDAARVAGVPYYGITVDCPYEYAIGTFPHAPWMDYPDQPQPTGESDPRKVDWMARLLDIEAEARKQGLHYNLLMNSQLGGEESGEAFTAKTLEFIDCHQASGGRPDGVIFQSWYPHPKEPLPETRRDTLCGLVRLGMEKLDGVDDSGELKLA